jgi:hypothetical protein
MSFGERFLKKWQPCLIWIAALRKVECTGSGLHDRAVLFFWAFAVLQLEPLVPAKCRLIKIFFYQIQLVINDFRNPFAVCNQSEIVLPLKATWERRVTSVKHEAVNADLLIPCYAHILNKVFLVAQGTERRHEPTIAVVALSYIVRGGALDEKLRVLENVLLKIELVAAGRKVQAATNLDALHG